MADSRLTLGPADRTRLAAGASELGVALDDAQVDRLADYAALLDTWSRRTNLIACRGPAELVDRHLLDSLVAAPILGAAGSIVDLGSGAGLPGVPLAIVLAHAQFVLVESRRKRANFLRTVCRAIGLGNVDVLEARAEDTDCVTRPADAAITRAVWPDATGIALAVPWVKRAGVVLRMRSGPSSQGFDLEGASASLQLHRTIEYRIGEGPVRSVDIFHRST